MTDGAIFSLMSHQQMTCTVCNKPYMAFRMELQDETYTRWSACPHCNPRNTEDTGVVTYDLKAEEARHRAYNLEQAEVPKAYEHCSFSTFIINNESHLNVVQACHDVVNGYIEKLLLYGSTGVGKTHLAVSVIRDAIERDMTGLYITEQDLIARIVLGSQEGFGGDKKVIRYLCDVDVLVIDEIGKGRLSAYDATLLFTVIDGRHSRRNKTVFVGNLSGKVEFEEHFTDPMISRMKERGKSVRLTGDDMRRIS